MNEIKRFLPIGTVVLLKNATKPLMINSYYVFSKENNEKVYEYGGCIYPQGVISPNSINAFNHEDIEKILYMGYVSEEQKTFCQLLDNNYNKIIDDINNMKFGS